MPRYNLTYLEKIKLINCVHQKGIDEAQRQFKVSRRTIYRYMKDEKEIIGKAIEGKGKMKKINGKTKNFDQSLKSFVKEMNENGYPLSYNMIKQKAIQLSKEFNFNASRGWFEKFKKRCGIKFGTLSGESAAVDQALVNSYKVNEIPLIKQKYPPENRYNMDETSIFYRQLPSKSFFVQKNKHFGNKLDKERITLLLGCNQNGEKLRPLVITKSKNPRSFRGRMDEIERKDIHLESNKAAWMTKDIFHKFIASWNEELSKNGNRVALILDNFSGHKVDESLFPFIEFFWLPPNTTSALQPLDAGIIKSFKNKYTKRLLLKIFHGFEAKLDFKKINKSITMLDAISWLAESWSEISNETIMNCWKKSGYDNDNEISEEIVGDEIDEIQGIYDNLPVKGKEKPTLVNFMENLTINDNQTYFINDENLSRGL